MQATIQRCLLPVSYTHLAPDDVRSAYTVQTIRENKNSSVIGDILELSTDSMMQSELFRTYYATGLSWPTVPQYIDLSLIHI